jgi:hypothetical protein
MRMPGLDDLSRARSPVKIDAAAKQVVREIIARRNRSEHFTDVRRFGTHVRNLIETSMHLLSQSVL